jgi:hypothetical protein
LPKIGCISKFFLNDNENEGFNIKSEVTTSSEPCTAIIFVNNHPDCYHYGYNNHYFIISIINIIDIDS